MVDRSSRSSSLTPEVETEPGRGGGWEAEDAEERDLMDDERRTSAMEAGSEAP